MSLAKVNITRIVADHLSTLKRSDGKGYHVADIFMFTALPLFAAIYYSVLIEPFIINNENRLGEIDSILVAAFSIFSALLLNLQMLVFSNKKPAFREKESSESPENYNRLKREYDDKSKFVQHLFFNVSYLILISIFCVLIGIASIIFFNSSSVFLNFFKMLLLFNFVVNLFMCLKRIHVLFSV